MRILVVDDEPDVVESVRLGFTLQWREVDVLGAGTGEAALDVVEHEHPDIVLLDVGLPDMDGFEVVRQIRAFSDVPVVMLTARDDAMDKVKGLELGADDYVTKPFSQRELLARIKAVLRRTEQKRATRRGETVRAYRFKGWELNTGTRKLRAPDGRNVELTNSEYALLVAFLKAPGRILTRDQLLESSRLHDDIYDRSIDVQILRLRRKVEESPNQPKLIRTERGAGYYLDSPVETV